MPEDWVRPMKKIFAAALTLCLCAALFSYSEEFFFEKIDPNDEDAVYWEVSMESARYYYDLSIATFRDQDVFDDRLLGILIGEDVLRILFGEEHRLNKGYLHGVFDLARVDNRYLRLLRNMVYARYGMIFKSDDLNTYFGKHKWYKPTLENVNKLLTDTDRDNVKLIQTFERRNENLPNVTWGTESEKAGIWQDDMPDIIFGWSERITILPNSRMEYLVMNNALICMAGVYSIKGNVLKLRAGEIRYNMPQDLELVQDSSQQHYSNTYKLKLPIVLKFPVSDVSIHSKTDTLLAGDSVRLNHTQRQKIRIGGKDFFKISNEPRSPTRKNTGKRNVTPAQAPDVEDDDRKKVPDVNWKTMNERVGLWHKTPWVPPGYHERYAIFPNNRMSYRSSQMEELAIFRNMTGAYSVNGDVVEFLVDEVNYWMQYDFHIYNSAGGIWWGDNGAHKNTIKFEKPVAHYCPTTDIDTILIEDGWDGNKRQMLKIGICGDYYKIVDDPAEED